MQSRTEAQAPPYYYRVQQGVVGRESTVAYALDLCGNIVGINTGEKRDKARKPEEKYRSPAEEERLSGGKLLLL